MGGIDVKKSPESKYAPAIESFITTLRDTQLNAGQVLPLSDFDKTRLSAMIALLNHEDATSSANQNHRLGTGLNWLTAALVIAAVLSAGATFFQAYETKRQTEIQLRSQSGTPPASQAAPANGRKDAPKTLQPKQ